MSADLPLSVVISTYNRMQLLARTLPTILNQDLPSEDYEIVIVVDGSTDGTLGYLRSVRSVASLRVVEQPNRGLASARNLGLHAARGKIVLFVDDDILCGPSVLSQHLAAHDSASIVAFGPIVVAEESFRNLGTEWTRTYTAQYVERLEREEQPRWPDDAIVEANTSVPRALLLSCGGYDESFARRQSVDLGLRLWRCGVPFLYLPSAVTHQIFVKAPRELVQDARDFGSAELRLSRKHPAYRPYSLFARLAEGPLWKVATRNATLRIPTSSDRLMNPPLWIVERFGWRNPRLRRAGVRLLQLQQAIAAYREAIDEHGSWSALHQEFALRLPVLLYHHVGPPQPGSFPELTISPKRFEDQVRWLVRRGYKGIRPSQWLQWRANATPLPDKPVLLTFDDAYADVGRHALPVLRHYGFGAAVYVASATIGKTDLWTKSAGTIQCMTADKIRQWSKDGIEFGAHSRTHADLTALSAAELADEVGGSADELQDVLGERVTSFAYPFGFYNDTVRREVERHFDLAFTTDRGLNHLSTDVHALRRTMVQPTDSLLDLECRLLFGWDPYERLRARIRVRTRLAQLRRKNM
jgi:glycosyltransferase involved in cell wall biosynthesis/peptidoglycan/xylan/chitin deacetylase (PgdA/CDA1 family)